MATDQLAVEFFVNDAKAIAALNRFRGGLAATDKQLGQLGRANTFAGTFNAQLERAQRRHIEFLRAQVQRERQAATQVAQARNSGGGGLGSGIGSALAGAGAGAAIGIAIQKSFEQEKAFRQMSAAATQAGLSYGIVAAEAQKYAAAAGASQTDSAKATAQLARLAAASGQTIEQVRKSVLDLAAARGIAANELETVISAVVTGSSDEPLNAIGLKDPGALAEDYAKKLGKSTEALTQQEQVLSRLLPLQEQANLFTGAAAERLASTGGQADLARARLDDLSTSIGTQITSSMEYRAVLGTLNEALGNYATNIQNVRAQLAQGVTPKQIAEQQADALIPSVLDYVKDKTGAVLGSVGFIGDILTGESLDIAAARFKEAAGGARGRRVGEQQQQIEADKRLQEKQNAAAAGQKNTNFLKAIEDRKKAEIAAGKKAADETEKATTKARQEAQQKFDKRISQASGDKGLARNRGLLSELQGGSQFKGDELAQRVEAIQERIDASIKGAKDKVRDYRTEVRSMFDEMQAAQGADNPFVRVYMEAQKAMEAVRVATRGLSAEQQVAFAKQQQLINANNLAKAQLENKFESIDLRADAKKFRDPSESERERRLNADFAAQGINVDENGKVVGLRGGASGRNVQAIQQYVTDQREIAKNMREGRERESLAEKIAAANLMAARDPEKRSIADRAIIGATQGVDPATLTSDQREDAAAAREREAARKDSAEGDAQKQAADRATSEAKLTAALEKLSTQAEKGGLEVIIKVLDETKDGIRSEKKERPKNSHTAALYGDQ